MAAGGRDLEHALGALLALDVGEIGQGDAARRDCAAGPGEDLNALEVVRELDQREGRQHLDVAAGQAASEPRRRGADEAMAAAVGGDGSGQHACDRGQRAVQREFAQRRETLQRIGRDRADGRHDAERDRQVVMRALLRQVGGARLTTIRRAGRARPEAVSAARTRSFDSAHRLVGQADEHEGDIARGHLHLDIDRAGLDALERNRRDARDHAGCRPLPSRGYGAGRAAQVSEESGGSSGNHGLRNGSQWLGCRCSNPDSGPSPRIGDCSCVVSGAASARCVFRGFGYRQSTSG